MSYLIAAPELMADAALNLANIGSTIGSANLAAAVATTGVLPAAADEVSASISALFSQHALSYQQLSAQAEAFHQLFVQTMNAGAGTYAAAEANVVQTMAAAVPALSVDLSGGLSGLAASLSADMTQLGAGLNLALSASLGGNLSGLAPFGAAIATDLNGGLNALAQTGGALATNIGTGLSNVSGRAERRTARPAGHHQRRTFRHQRPVERRIVGWLVRKPLGAGRRAVGIGADRYGADKQLRRGAQRLGRRPGRRTVRPGRRPGPGLPGPGRQPERRAVRPERTTDRRVERRFRRQPLGSGAPGSRAGGRCQRRPDRAGARRCAADEHPDGRPARSAGHPDRRADAGLNGGLNALLSGRFPGPGGGAFRAGPDRSVAGRRP